MVAVVIAADWKMMIDHWRGDFVGKEFVWFYNYINYVSLIAKFTNLMMTLDLIYIKDLLKRWHSFRNCLDGATLFGV